MRPLSYLSLRAQGDWDLQNGRYGIIRELNFIVISFRIHIILAFRKHVMNRSTDVSDDRETQA
jgi:hypothetical protein